MVTTDKIARAKYRIIRMERAEKQSGENSKTVLLTGLRLALTETLDWATSCNEKDILDIATAYWGVFWPAPTRKEARELLHKVLWEEGFYDG